MKSINMLDLQAEFRLFETDIRAAIDRVLQSQHFIGGKEIAELETALATRVGAAHAIAISNGTDALLVALMGLNVGPGDEVIVPAFTFFATAGSVVRVGAKPVFADIDPRTFNLDPAAVQSAITPRTKAIMPVHLFGQCADMDAINAIARKHGLKVIEDAAQAIGATYRGKQAGTLGDAASLSFYPTKNLGGFGEGGMIFTQDAALATLLKQLRNHGESQRYVHERVGGNFRLDTMKAGMLLAKLKHLSEFTRKRQANAGLYNQLLADSPVTTPYVAEGNEHVYHQYSILADRRDELVAALKDKGVGTGIYYPVPLHLQRCFADLNYEKGSLPVTERACERIVSLPCHPMLSPEDVRYVAECVNQFLPRRDARGRSDHSVVRAS